MATAPTPDKRQRLRLVQADGGRRLEASRRPVNPLLLILGVLGGPVAFGIVRVAGLLLISGSCQRPVGSATVLGLSPPQVSMAIVTVLGALVAASAGLLSWHLWQRTRRPSEDRSGESLRAAPFWALGGVFLSGIFFVAVLLTGGLALGLGATCVA